MDDQEELSTGPAKPVRSARKVAAIAVGACLGGLVAFAEAAAIMQDHAPTPANFCLYRLLTASAGVLFGSAVGCHPCHLAARISHPRMTGSSEGRIPNTVEGNIPDFPGTGRINGLIHSDSSRIANPLGRSGEVTPGLIRQTSHIMLPRCYRPLDVRVQRKPKPRTH
jgi:hypothetical protein